MNARPRYRVEVIEQDGTFHRFESDQSLSEIVTVSDISRVRSLKVEQIHAAPVNPIAPARRPDPIGEELDD